MTKRQCEIAAEAYAASILARCGYDILVQYGAHQPHFDLAAVKGTRNLLISVKGSKDGGWVLAPKSKGSTYQQAIDEWLQRQREDVVFMFVQFEEVKMSESPHIYIARPQEIAREMSSHKPGGYGVIYEARKAKAPSAPYHIPSSWDFTAALIDRI